jgi:hypothetical protein
MSWIGRWFGFGGNQQQAEVPDEGPRSRFHQHPIQVPQVDAHPPASVNLEFYNAVQLASGLNFIHIPRNRSLAFQESSQPRIMQPPPYLGLSNNQQLRSPVPIPEVIYRK